MKINLKRQECYEYCWKKREQAAAAVLAAGVTGLLGFFFYRSVWAVPALSPVGIIYYRGIQRNRMERYREEMTAQFRECILAVATLLQAGYSAENAFLECGRDMRMMYGKDAPICRELDILRRGLQINIALEELLQDLAGRSGCEEISQFAQIFSLAKRNGGNMAAIIRSSAVLIGKQIELRLELKTLLAGKRMELNIMKAMPFGILAYISFGNPGYFDMLYHSFPGVALMTGCLAAYLGACLLGDRVIAQMTAEV